MSYSIYDQNLRLCLTINVTPVGFMVGFKRRLRFIDRLDRGQGGHK